MEPKEPSSRELGTGYKYVTLGISFGLGIVLWMGLGFMFDRWLGWSPILTVVGTVVGSVLSFVWVFARLKADEQQYHKEHPHKFDRVE
jgi:F0F1-type ATP synthase assembly protein I